MEFAQRDFSRERNLGQKRVAHFLSLKHGILVGNMPTQEAFIIVVSGGCTIAIKVEHFVDGMLEINSICSDPKGIVFVTTQSANFKQLPLQLRDNMPEETSKFRVMDVHDILFQKWHTLDNENPINEIAKIRPSMLLIRRSDSKMCVVLKVEAGKVILYQL